MFYGWEPLRDIASPGSLKFATYINAYMQESGDTLLTDEAERLMGEVTTVLKEHIPVHLKKMAKDLAYLRLFEDAISAPTALLFERKFLIPYHGGGLLPTTYVILK